MDIKEYLKRATDKIYNNPSRKAVSLELEDHILRQEEFYEEIGYDKTIGEEKAVEDMGETEEVAKQFGELHNNNHNYVIDGIFIFLWLVCAFATARVLSKFEGDSGAMPLYIASALFYIGLYFFICAVNVKRNKIAPLAMSYFIIGTMTSAFAVIVWQKVVKCGYDSIKAVYDLVCNGIFCLPKTNLSTVDYSVVRATGLAVFVIFTIIFAINLILIIRYENQSNGKIDNSIKKALKYLCCVAGLIIIAFAVMIGSSIFNIQNKVEKSYMQDYHLVFDIVENCESIKDVEKFAKDNHLDYTGKQDSISIKGKIALISVNKFVEEQEEQKGFGEVITKAIADSILKAYPDSYGTQYGYNICFALDNMSMFRNGYDSLALRKIFTKPEDLDYLFDIQARDRDVDMIEVYGSYYPKSIIIQASNNHKTHNSLLTFEYSVGSGDNAFSQKFEDEIVCEKEKTVNAQKAKMIKILKENPDISNKELAEKLKVKYRKPDVSLKEVKALYNQFNTMFESVLTTKEIDEYAKATHKQLYYFEFSDDLIAYRGNPTTLLKKTNKNENVILFDSKTNLRYKDIEVIEEGEPKEVYSSSFLGLFKKTIFEGIGYFDRNGHAYENCEDVAYYSRDGERFRFYEEVDAEGKRVETYFIGSKGTTCITDNSYVDDDGYFFADFDNSIRKDSVTGSSEIETYHDQEDNHYRKACEVSWDSNGKLLDYDKYK